jgi:hypothetical protein
MTSEFKKVVSSHNHALQEHKAKQGRKQAMYDQAGELDGKLKKLEAAVMAAQEKLSEAEQAYTDTGNYSAVEAAMKRLAAIEGEYAVAKKTLTPLIEKCRNDAAAIDREPLGMFGPNLPYGEAAKELLSTVPEIGLFVYLMGKEWKDSINRSILTHRLGYLDDHAKFERQFAEMMRRAS